MPSARKSGLESSPFSASIQPPNGGIASTWEWDRRLKHQTIEGTQMLSPAKRDRLEGQTAEESLHASVPSVDPVLERMLCLDRLPLGERLRWIRATLLKIGNEKDCRLAQRPYPDSYDGIACRATIEVLDIKRKSLEQLYERIVEQGRSGSDVGNGLERR